MAGEKVFSANLCTVMEAKAMSVRQAAKIAGVSVSTLQSWRTGSSPNDYFAVRRLAVALGTTLTWLLTGEEETPIPFDAQDQRLSRDARPFFSGYAHITVHKIKRSEDNSSDPSSIQEDQHSPE